ncbi:MAG: NAD-dependent DNA ligase LigA [bacterium]
MADDSAEIVSEASYLELLRLVTRYAHAYYVLDDPLVSDEIYDYHYQRLLAFEIKHPLMVSSVSPTQRVGNEVSSDFSKVRHSVVMLSLSNVFSYEQLSDFLGRVYKACNLAEIDCVVQPKIDGLAVTIVYEKGVFVKAATRGDGRIGEDVTHTIKTIRSLPLILSEAVDIEVRGEVYVKKSVFRSFEGQFATPRHAAAGAVRQMDPAVAAKRGLDVFVYSIVSSSLGFETDCLTLLKRLGFSVISPCFCARTVEDIFQCCLQLSDNKTHFDFDIDGAVVKVNDVTVQTQLGHTAKSPRWAVAYKFADEQAMTVVEDIVVQVGRTGVLTPVACLKAVMLSGVTVQRATLHNFAEIERLGIAIGDKVLIQRAGEVIPKILGVLEKGRDGRCFVMPKVCPCCGVPIVKDTVLVAFRCTNQACTDKIKAQLKHFVMRKAMNIDGLGEQIVSQLVDAKKVRRLVDCYFLTLDDLMELDGIAEKSAHALLEAIDASKMRPFSAFLFGLGIPFVGQQSALLLAEAFGSMQSLMVADREALLAVPGIGDKMVEAMRHLFCQPAFIEMIAVFDSLGMPIPYKKECVSGPLTGQVVLVTGVLEGMSREDVKQKIELLGGRVVTQVSKQLTMLIVGEKPGSKLKKVLNLNEKGADIRVEYGAKGLDSSTLI